MSTLRVPRSVTIVPNDEQGRLAGQAAVALGGAEELGNGQVAVGMIGPGGERQILFPAQVVPLIVDILARLETGEIVTIIPEGAELTIPEAADLLNVSKPFVAGLFDRGEIPSKGEGAFRRVVYRDLLAYKARSDAECAAALDELTELSQDMGLY